MPFQRHELNLLLPNLLATINDSFPEQKEAVCSDARWVLIGAASRTGKTFAGGRAFMRKLTNDYVSMPWGAEREYWCVAPTFDDCRAQKLELLKLIPEWMIDWEKQGDKKEFFDESHGRGFVFLIGGATIMFKSAERPERLVAFKLRGIWWTEIARSKVAAWPNVYARLSNYSDSWFIADTSPLGRCWFYQDVWQPAISGKFRNVSTHTWTAAASPYVPREVIEEARINLPPAWYAREFEASWDAFQGQIYDVDDRIHVCERPHFQPEWAIMACDVNTTSTHPAEFVWAVGTGAGDKSRLWVEGCYQKVIGLDYDTYAGDIAAQAKALRHRFGHQFRLIVDPSFHTSLKQKLYNAGVSPVNADNEVLPGIRTLGSILMPLPGSGPRLTFSPKARPALDQLKAMKWVVASDGVVRAQPDKTLDDGYADSLRYLSMAVVYGGAKQIR